MDVTREIRCKGCGGAGKVVWREVQWHADVRPVREPLRVTGNFFLFDAGTPKGGKVIACERCQQRQPEPF